MKALESLFDVWEQKHIETGYKRFIRDGIVDEEWWLQPQNMPKICFFLKEARTEREEGYNLVRDLYEYKPWKMWQKVAIWTQAIQSAFVGEQAYNEEQVKSKPHAAVRQIAVVNVKKSDGLAESDKRDLWKYMQEDKEELKKEFEIINPDIIVCGSTFEMLKEILGEEAEVEKTQDILYGFWRDKLIINYYHPACHYPNRVNYYALMSICRMASVEWEKRKTGCAR